jgi:pseudouridine synthase, rluA family
MTETIKKAIPTTNEDAGARLDVFLSEKEPSLSRSRVQKLIEDGCVLVNGRLTVSKNYKLREADYIEIEYPLPAPCRAEAEDIPIDIRYEDEDIIVVNKPKGMVVHPAAGHYTGTLVSALLHHCGDSLSGIGGILRPGIVHRIDKDTSGLIVAAKNDAAHLALSEQLKEHRISRVYQAIALGKIEENCTIDLPIGRHPADRKKMAVTDKNSKNAITHVEVLERFPALTYVKCILETGRTHQIRVHLAHIGHPLLGDAVYGSMRQPMNARYGKYTAGQCLHAGKLSLTHPRTGERLHLECELPDYFRNVLALLEAGK